MPFIFNNTDYLLIDNGDEFDKNEFVVAKKLFIRYKSNSYVEVSIEKSQLFKNI